MHSSIQESTYALRLVIREMREGQLSDKAPWLPAPLGPKASFK